MLVKGAFGSLALRVISVLLMLMVSIVLARMLGPTQFGIYSVVLSLVSLLAVPAQMGLPTLVVRETATAYVWQRWGVMRGLWHWATRKVLSLALLLAILALLVGERLLPGEAEHRTMLLVLAALLIPLNVLNTLRGAALQGLRHVVLGQLPELVINPLLLGALIVGVSLVMQTRLDAITAIALHIFSVSFSFALGAYLLWRLVPPALRARPEPIYEARAWRAAALPIALTTGLQVLNQNIDIVMLGWLRSAEEAGIYKIAVSAAAIVSLGLGAVNQALAPHFARLHQLDDYGRLQRLVTLSARGILALSLPPMLLMVLAGEEVLTLFFGHDYASGKTALAIIAFGQLVNAAMGSVGLLLNMTGHERQTFRAVLAAAFANVGLNLALIPAWGAIGAAIAATTSLVVWNVIMWLAVRRLLGIETMAFPIFTFEGKK